MLTDGADPLDEDELDPESLSPDEPSSVRDDPLVPSSEALPPPLSQRSEPGAIFEESADDDPVRDDDG